MLKENLFEKASWLKDRFRSFIQHRKKVAALENFAQAEPVMYQNEVKLIKLCMTGRFLSQKGADFLEELLEEHHVNYLDWAHRTKWLKRKIADKRKENRQKVFMQPTLLDLLDPKESTVPVEIIANLSKNKSARI